MPTHYPAPNPLRPARLASPSAAATAPAKGKSRHIAPPMSRDDTSPRRCARAFYPIAASPGALPAASIRYRAIRTRLLERAEATAAKRSSADLCEHASPRHRSAASVSPSPNRKRRLCSSICSHSPSLPPPYNSAPYGPVPPLPRSAPPHLDPPLPTSRATLPVTILLSLVLALGALPTAPLFATASPSPSPPPPP